ncbi:MAG TPA: orotate phosphoribosyltransferase [Longimicrobiales bacterium]|nr:orotate phosphoribosyltransferase [Longimicrobiales bacterium]
MIAVERAELLELLRQRSLSRGDFVLASGARSGYYIDARRTSMSGAGQRLIGRLGLVLLDQRGWRPQLIGGLTLGADPVAYAIAHAAALVGRTLDAFTVRKEAKGHGAGRLIEGADVAGRDVVVVEDTITTGGSALRAIQALEGGGARILGVLALVDRGEGGASKLQEAGYTVAALATAGELLDA